MSRPKKPTPARQRVDAEHTRQRILAFLHSVRPLRGVAEAAATDEAFQAGRMCLEKLALSAQGDAPPAMVLLKRQCADVLAFLAMVEPLEPSTWWTDPKGAPSPVVGYQLVLRALEEGVRRYVP